MKLHIRKKLYLEIILGNFSTSLFFFLFNLQNVLNASINRFNFFKFHEYFIFLKKKVIFKNQA